MENISIVVVDSSFALTVAPEKAILVREVLKHFRKRWQGDAAAAAEALAAAETSCGSEDRELPAPYSLSQSVTKMLKHLQIDYGLCQDIISVNILNENEDGNMEHHDEA